MIYLSQLLIDTGGNPDRPRPGRKWLENVYNVHRRLCMAFPAYKRPDDPHFLKPFKEEHYKHAERPFLFRVDNKADGGESRAVIIVQSDTPPDWEWCFHNARDFLAAPPQTREYDPSFSAGQQLRYRVLANPSVKRRVEEYEIRNGEKVYTGRKLHKRVSFTWEDDTTPDDALAAWFASKAARLGFTPLRTELVRLGWVYGSKPEPVNDKPKKNGNGYWRKNEYRPMRYRSALLEGYLRVDNPDVFHKTIIHGFGKAKSMGFGLLSVIKA